MIVTCLAREAATTAMLEALKESPDSQLASRARKMVQEEQFHLVFGVETARGFAAMPGKTRESLAEDYRRALANVEAELGAEQALTRLTALGALPARALDARTRFLQSITQRLNDAWG
jgi:1,2-phenylacetyl-CoA epoxidase catalytic subunit